MLMRKQIRKTSRCELKNSPIFAYPKGEGNF